MAAHAAPQRIISLAPNTTEILYGVGAIKQVIAVSDYCTYPAEVKNLPHVGAWQTTNLEKITALRPDLVVMPKSQEKLMADSLNGLHIRYIAVPSDTLQDIFEAIRMIGDATGHVVEAQRLAADVRGELEGIRKRAATLPHPTVLIAASRTPGTLRDLFVAVDGSYLADLATVAGARVVGGKTASGYAQLGKEALLSLNPDVILDLSGQSDARQAWSELPMLSAVKNGRVYGVDDPFVVHPSQFAGHTAELFFKALHPGAR